MPFVPNVVMVPRDLIAKAARGEVPPEAIIFVAAVTAYPDKDQTKIASALHCEAGVQAGRDFLAAAPSAPRVSPPASTGTVRYPGDFAKWLREECLSRFSSEYAISREKMGQIWAVLSEAPDPKASAEKMLAIMEDVDQNQNEIKSPGAFAAGFLQKQGLEAVDRLYEKLTAEGTAVKPNAARAQDRARQLAEEELAKRSGPTLDPAYASDGAGDEEGFEE